MAVRHVTLVANQVTPVAFAQPFTQFEIINKNGAAEVYFTIGSPPADPTVDGNDVEVLPAAITGQQVTVYGDPIRESTVVKLLSTGTPRVAVRAW